MSKIQRAIVIDDEFNSRRIVKKLISLNCEGSIQVLAEAASVEEGIELINALKPDVVFLDLHLNGKNGFQILENTANKTFKTIIITAYEDYGIKAVKSGAIDYLLKPVNPQEFRDCLENLKKINQDVSTELAESRYITFSGRAFKRKINVKEILYLKSDSNYTTIHLTSGKSFMIAKTLKKFEDDLDASIFVRCHQSYIINLQNILEAVPRKSLIILTSGERIPISRRKKDEFFNILFPV